MPTSVDSLLVLLLFVLPGFLAVEIDSRFRPTRERSAFDKTALSVLFSAAIHAVLLPLATAVAVYGCAVDPSVVNRAWIKSKLIGDPLGAELITVGYFAITSFAGALAGYLWSQWTGERPPVWALETYIRIQRPNRIQSFRARRDTDTKFTGGLSVLVMMKDDGGTYTGMLKSLPGEFDDLQRKDKFFSIEKAEWFNKDGKRHTLGPSQVVLLNTEDAQAMWIGVEPFPQKAIADHSPAIAAPTAKQSWPN